MGFASNQAFAGFNPIPPGDMLNPFLGDFKCYDVNVLQHFTDDVNLEDQFLTEQYDVEDIIKICTMVFKTGEGIDPSVNPQFFDEPFFGTDEQHYVVYQLCRESSEGANCVPADPVDVPVSITDQFGTTDHVIPHIPVELWVPSQKDVLQCPVGYNFNSGTGMCVGPPSPCPLVDATFPQQGLLSQYSGYVSTCEGPPGVAKIFNQEQNIHWKCYDIEPKVIGTKALILFDDNFFPGGDDVQLDTADKLCNPVIKNQGAQQSLDIEHLKCYEFTVKDTVQADLRFFDQFFPNGVFIDPIDGVDFCSAADKFLFRFIGGTIIPIDATSFALAGIQTTASWMIPVVVAGIGMGFVVLRKFKN